MEFDLTQQRVLKVLERIKEAVEKDPDDAQVYSEELDFMLDEMSCHDFFGTEGQCDPRGDQRSGRGWSMEYVQGIDD